MGKATDNIQKAALAAGLSYVGYKVLDSQVNIGTDLTFAMQYLPAARRFKYLENERPDYTVADSWDETCAQNRTGVCIINADTSEEFTFGQIDEASNRVAHWALANGLKQGDVVALFMENRPEFMETLIGLAKVGIVVAMINTANKQKPLIHSIEISLCKTVIYGTELSENIEGVVGELQSRGLTLISMGPDSNPEYARAYENEANDVPVTRISRTHRNSRSLLQPFGYIYTSGTTGLPKACVITNHKYISSGMIEQHFCGATAGERIYTCLPLFHSAGGMLGAGAMVTSGLTLVLARRFSGSRFFEHCTKFEVDHIQYIGELCRYLLNSPPSQWDRKHHVRTALGNGLRREIWAQFCDRFNIMNIREFYGATEGNVGFMNQYTHTPEHFGLGAMGRTGLLIKKILAFEIVKHDVESEEPVRDPKTGLCVPCAFGENGELLGKISTMTSSKFQGYTNKEDTDKKVMKDVFVKGDMYFRCGDLVRQESDGFVYFVDRIGDTFRWKGENVSTGEVSEVISVIDGIHEANVYGVKVPGNEDGRACMTALVTEDGNSPNMEVFAAETFKSLATFAMPMFVRVLPKMDITGTFKHRKVDFVKEGFDITRVQDPIFMLDLPTKSYVPLTPERYQEIIGGTARL